MKPTQRLTLSQSRRIIVKLGTSSILHRDGRVQGEVLLPLAEQIATLRGRGVDVIIVSSGAVGMGRRTTFGAKIEPKQTSTKQALAALGQVELMNMWRGLFEMLGLGVAQVLLTRQELSRRERYLNARNTLCTLLSAGIIPIVNENDSVATDEIKFGDNDILSALVSSVVEADLVVNLTQAEGLLDLSGGDSAPVLISEVSAVDDDLFKMVAPELSQGGTGGMASKLHAAKEAARYGAAMVIANSGQRNVLLDILEGKSVGTLFYPAEQPLRGRKRWLASSTMVGGALIVDEGAERALTQKGSSLLGVGVTETQGEFGVGAVVAIRNSQGRELGRGLCELSSTDLGRQDKSETGVIVHRNNLFLH